MPKVIIVYDSKTGNTEAMARAIAEGTNTVKNVQVELYKVGTCFAMGVLNDADALIVGSPTEYGNATSGMRDFLESMTELAAAKKLHLKGKSAGVFGSYGWNGGWLVDMLRRRMERVGMKIVEPIVSAPEKLPTISYEQTLKQCRKLGNAVATEVRKA
jgi:flavodoxin I